MKEFNLDLVSSRYLAYLEVKSTLEEEVCQAQARDPSIEGIKKNIPLGTASGFSLDQDGTLRYENRLCVPNHPELKEKILKEAHDTPLSIHP